MVANLYGDFVKGKDLSSLPDIVRQGVNLHRSIDDFIDHHEKITELRRSLYSELPKIASIAIDLYMDHILAKNWTLFSTTPLDEFVAGFFRYALNEKNQIITHNNSTFEYPAEFTEILKIMDDRKWLLRYQKMEGLIMASEGLCKRISFQNNLNEAPQVFMKHIHKIEETFFLFMKDANAHFEHID